MFINLIRTFFLKYLHTFLVAYAHPFRTAFGLILKANVSSGFSEPKYTLKVFLLKDLHAQF